MDGHLRRGPNLLSGKHTFQRQLRLEMPLLTLVVADRVFLFEGVSMLWTIFAILIILWLLGWGFHVAGGLIHLLLVIALVVAVINLVTGRRTV
jgi:hypothetical protein